MRMYNCIFQLCFICSKLFSKKCFAVACDLSNIQNSKMELLTVDNVYEDSFKSLFVQSLRVRFLVRCQIDCIPCSEQLRLLRFLQSSQGALTTVKP